MRSIPMLLALAAALGASACSTENPGGLKSSGGTGDNEITTGASSGGNSGGTGGDDAEVPPEKTILDERVVDYGEALRTASLKLMRALPTLEQIKKVSDAGNAAEQKAAYEAEIDAMFDDPRFAQRMIKFWRDTMRQGGGAADGKPSRDTAPVFAARLMVEGKPFTDMFTATSNTCPTYSGDNQAFADGDCNNNVATHAGVLTNPGSMNHFYGNMAFRRVRWVQETFVCTKFPAEYSASPVAKGASEYVSPWPFEAMAQEPIDFQDYSSVICANCHSTMNRLAPLFANFNENGMWTDQSQVETPVTPPVKTERSHWLKENEPTAWRHGQLVDDLPGLGAAIAADPDVRECAVARMWNFTMSKEDIVSDLATVPYEVLVNYIEEFEGNGLDLKAVLRSMFKGPDFIRF